MFYKVVHQPLRELNSGAQKSGLTLQDKGKRPQSILNLADLWWNVPWSGSENWRKSIDCFHKWTSCIKWWYNFGPGRRWFVIMFYKVVQLWQRDYAHSVCRLDFTLQDRGSRFNKQRVVDAATSFRGVKLKFYKKSSILARLSDTFEVEVF